MTVDGEEDFVWNVCHRKESGLVAVINAPSWT